MNILLVDPPFQRFMLFHRYYYPMGLASMAAVLKRQGHAVTVYDAERLDEGETLSWSAVAGRHGDYLEALQNPAHPVWREIEATIRKLRPQIVGITALSVKAASAVRVAEICKAVDPGIAVVVGGDHPTVFPEQLLAHSCIDFAVRGEGEAAFAELVACLAAGTAGTATLAGVSGKSGGTFRHGPDRKPIADLDSLPLPDLDALIDVKRYRPVDFGAIMTSRGCPYGCTFCGVSTVWGRRIRYRSPASVIEEIVNLKDQRGTTYFSFRDASFTINRQRILEICRQIIDRRLDIRWECLTRVDLLDEELLNLMIESGCATIRLGIESGSPRILRDMGKTASLDDVRRAAALLNRLGLYWSAYILAGTPQETAESLQETMDFITEIDPPFVTLARFAPIPGTRMYEDLEKHGMISSGIDWSMECNQRLSSHYLYGMSEPEFEQRLATMAAFVETRNATRSAAMHTADQRLK